MHHIAGEDCYLVKVRCASTGDARALLQEKLGAFPAMRRTRTTIVLGTVKERLELPIPSGRRRRWNRSSAGGDDDFDGRSLFADARSRRSSSVYLVWGSTYLAIRLAIETLPTFTMAGVRFLIAGALLYALGAPARRQAPGGAARSLPIAVIGALLLRRRQRRRGLGRASHPLRASRRC